MTIGEGFCEKETRTGCADPPSLSRDIRKRRIPAERDQSGHARPESARHPQQEGALDFADSCDRRHGPAGRDARLRRGGPMRADPAFDDPARAGSGVANITPAFPFGTRFCTPSTALSALPSAFHWCFCSTRTSGRFSGFRRFSCPLSPSAFRGRSASSGNFSNLQWTSCS